MHDGPDNIGPSYSAEIDDAIEVFVIPESPSPKPKSTKRKRRKEQDEDPRVEMAYSFLKNSLETEKDDARSACAKYIAHKLNQFDPMTQSILTYKTSNI